MSQPEPSLPSAAVVVIDLRTIYDAVVELRAQVGLLVHQHSNLIQDLRDHEKRAETLSADHERRLRSLERLVWSLPSVAVLLALGSLAVAVVSWLTR